MKKLLRFVPMQLTLCLILGIIGALFYNFQSVFIGVLLLLLAIVLAIVYFISKKKDTINWLFSILTYVLMFFIGIASFTFKSQLNETTHYTKQNFQKDSVYISLISIKKVLKSNDFYFKYEGYVDELDSINVTGKILLNIQKKSLKNELKVDDLLFVKTRFKEIPKPKNPFGFNYKRYLQNQQINHQITIYNNQFFKKVGTKKTITGLAAAFRENINKSLIKNGFKNEELAVINALVLGQRQTVSKDLLDDYSKAGAIHILAVSGLHIGIILLILSFILKPLEHLKNGKMYVSFIIIFLLWVYAVIAGLSPSIVRAVTMFSAVTIGLYANRRTNVYNSLVISMFFLLLIHPFYLFEVGFQLSYLAVFSIVWLQPKFESLWKPKIWIVNKMWQLFTVSFAAQIGVAPLSIFYFKQFPGLFFISNLVIIPFLGLILTFGFLVIALSILNILPKYFTSAYQFVIELLNSFVSWIASQESFILENLSISIPVLLLVYISIIFFFKWIEKGYFKRLVFFLVAIIGIISMLIFEKYIVETSNEFVVFHKNKASVVGIRHGEKFQIYAQDSLIKNTSFIKDYSLEYNLKENTRTNLNSYFYKFNNEEILVIDSLGQYKYKVVEPTVILLQKSPKVNLERLIDTHKPRLIIADGSNYKSYVKRWEKTCIKKKTPFYNTLQKGAFNLKDELIIP